MELMVQRCAGIDIGKATLAACVRTPAVRGRGRSCRVRSFGTTTVELLRLAEWLTAERVERIGMESTGQYWRPVYYLLEEATDAQVWLLNARHMRNVPGRKSDVSDAQWIAQLVEHGLVRPSFVPPEPIRQLRDLTRYRTGLTAERTREVQRLQDVLEDAGIKLDCLVSDITGRSARQMLAGLVAGERDPRVLAERALGRMRPKIEALQDALVGRFNDHHARLVTLMLARIDRLDADIAELTGQIDAQIRPFQNAITHLRTIPGVSHRIAQIIIAETGGDMAQFPTPGQLASWAGMCPGNHESAGRHGPGTTRKGDRWLRGALGEAAAAASRTKHTYLADRYHRLAGRRGSKRALVAVGHDILIATWYMLTADLDYHDLGANYHTTHTGDPKRKAARLAHQIQALGYRVTLDTA